MELASNLRVLEDYLASPSVAATFRGSSTLQGRFRLIATALERAHAVRFAQDSKMDLWDLREGQLRMMGEVLTIRKEMEAVRGIFLTVEDFGIRWGGFARSICTGRQGTPSVFGTDV